MDKKKSILNISTSVLCRLITIALSIVVKRMLIFACGNEVNGLNALFLSLIGFLSVAELGVGSAITFCMYKPIVDEDHNKVAALYHLFQKVYMIVGAIMLVGGLVMTPFLPHFAKDYTQLNVNMYLSFVLILISIVITYVFGAKTSLINAYKDNYITTAIASGSTVLVYLLQILVLWLTKSYIWYLGCRIVAAIAQWLITEYIARKKHGAILKIDEKTLDAETKTQLTRSIKAMFMHKAGNFLVNTVDSLVISFFVGVIALGKYSNYTSLQTAMEGMLFLVFSSLTSIFGHLYAEKTKETTMKYFERMHLLNYVIASIFYLGYYAVIDNLIEIFFTESLVIEKSISFVIALNGFVQYMRQSVLAFRDATGAFYNDRWKPLVEGFVNIVLSIAFVKLIGVVGVIVATIITNLLICHVVEPYVLFKNAFCQSPKRFYFNNYGKILIFILSMLVFNTLLQSHENPWIEFLANGFISVGVSVTSCVVVTFLQPDMRKTIFQKLLKKA